MSIPSILLPVFVYVALVFALLILLGVQRRRAYASGDAQRSRSLLVKEDGWPLYALQASNAVRNQFEVPVLFLALVPLAMITRKADLLFVILSWVFVISRYVHAIVHVTSNDLRLRFPSYVIGVLVLLAMWVIFAIQILAAV